MLFYADAVQRLGLVLPVRFLVLHSPLLSLLLAVCPRTHAFNAIALCGIQAILQWLQEGALRAFVYVWQTDEVADDASLSVGATPHAHTQGPVALHAGKSTAQLIQDLQTSKQAADAGHSEALAQLDGYVCLVYRTVYLRYVRVCVCVDTLICKGVYVCVCICV
eukprot:m.780226 g.780226  ORF g.780226 m.780226 type:complete len:164 (-) comp23280_c2_seq20:243-734(-)